MESFVSQKKGLCSIEIGPDGIAVVFVSNSYKPEITICEFQPYQNPHRDQLDYDRLKEYLATLVSKHNLKKSHCNWVLHPSFYQLTLVNAPNVPSSEYKQAMRWQMKDIINYPLEDMTVDIFHPNEPDKNLKKIYVVAAQNSFLQKVVDIIQDCDLYPVAIDIREFAIRNLFTSITTPNDTTGIFNIFNDICLMVLVKQHTIQFVRRIPISLKNLTIGNYDDLITEIQRSFSYCQTELNQEIPKKFFMLPKIDYDQDITQKIANNLNKEISVLNPQHIIAFTTQTTQQTATDCWAAIGGALRNTL